MRPIRIEGADPKPLGAPDNWSEADHGHCTALFVRRETVDGMNIMRSGHEVETGEAALMLAGAQIHLGIEGDRHPVIQMGLGPLPSDFEPVMTARRFNAPDGRPFVRVEMVYPHAGGRRCFDDQHVDGTLADAVSTAIIRIENRARIEGWIE